MLHYLIPSATLEELPCYSSTIYGGIARSWEGSPNDVFVLWLCILFVPSCILRGASMSQSLAEQALESPFEGFLTPDRGGKYFPMPLAFVDLLPRLTGAMHEVAVYLFRHTWG